MNPARHGLLLALASTFSLALAGCSAEAIEEGAEPDGTSTSMEEISTAGCTTSTVRGLSLQLIAEANCISPGSFGRYSGTGISLGTSAFPYLQGSAARALRRAVVARGGTLGINSALRTLPQQYMLYNWYRNNRCGVTLAASPGTSPHERGLAIDTSQYSQWRGTLGNHGFRWHGAGDVVHFDYVGSGATNLAGLSVRAFQRLWNRNHSSDQIAVDGSYGPQTAARLARAPSGGFAIGACLAGRQSLSVDAEDLVLDVEPSVSSPEAQLDPRLTDAALTQGLVSDQLGAMPSNGYGDALVGLSPATADLAETEGFISEEQSTEGEQGAEHDHDHSQE